ncbi:MAG TPA: hypothetical protein VFU43_04285 [Streptosporangiaceae bacterium]|nr:hypothetical protein [Streptosporangiaceae bacterium]
MRVYLPSTLPALARALSSGAVGPVPVRAYAVTPALREWYAEGDLEELEYAALTAAARASLRLIADAVDTADAAATAEVPPRRVVLAADVSDDVVTKQAGDAVLDDGAERALVWLMAPIPLTKIVSGHVDDLSAAGDIRAAVAALPAADAGDEDAQFSVGAAEGHELMWYATQELSQLFG